MTGRYAQVNDGSFTELEVNRLSGRFPPTARVHDVKDLSALHENLFGCEYIPEEDEYSEEYTCGSEELDLFLLTALSLVLLVILCCLAVQVHPMKRYWSKELNLFIDNGSDNFKYLIGIKNPSELSSSVKRIHSFVQSVHTCAKLFVTIVLIHLITCIPLYIVKISQHGLAPALYTTHTYQYRWLFSAAFTSGEVPLVLIAVMWLIAVLSFGVLTIPHGPFVHWIPWTNKIPDDTPKSKSGQSDHDHTNTSNRFLGSCPWITRFLAVIFVNSTIVGGVYCAYILGYSQSLRSSTLVAIQMSLGTFKILWNTAVVPVLARQMKITDNVIRTEMALLILNSLLLPCISAALTSPACFQVS